MSSGQFIDTISPRTNTLTTGIAIDSMNTVYVSGGSTVLATLRLTTSKNTIGLCIEIGN